MSTFSVAEPSQTATLEPGHYWIEMTFDRPTSPDVLLRALRTIGFDSVGIEMEDPALSGGKSRVGAVSAVSTLSSASARPVAARTATASPIQAASASPTRPRASAPVASPIQAAMGTPTTGSDLRAPDPTPAAPVPRAVAVPQPRAGTGTGPGAAQAPAVDRSGDKWKPTYGQGTGAGDGAPASPTPPTGPLPPTPPVPGGYDDAHPSASPNDAGASEDPYGYAAGGPEEAAPPGYYQPSGGGGGGGGSMADEDAAAPTGVSSRTSSSVANAGPSSLQAASRTPPTPGAVLLNPQGGAPMWLVPAGTNLSQISVGGRLIVGGAAPGPDASTSFRFVAHLGHAIDIRSLPGLRWTIIHELGFDPWGPMSFRLTPHTLEQGQLYDLRFLSRDKTAKQKADVLALLTSMGFRPATLFLSKRNMRIPGRPLTTLSEWFGVGRWDGPDSVVVSSDPFYFAEARPTS